MKAAFLLVLAAVTLYMAGIYRSGIVMCVAIIEFLLWIFMAVLVRILAGKCKVVSWGNAGRCVRGERAGVSLIVENKGMLPVWYFRAGILRRGGKYSGQAKLTYHGQVKPHERVDCRIEVVLEHCGLERFIVEKVYVWDSLRLFRRRIKANLKECIVPVFPREYVMDIEAAEGESLLAAGNDLMPMQLVGEDVQEILQYNEYMPGDSFKNIHWKLSARTDEIWVKKFSRAQEHRVTVFVNLVEPEKVEEEQEVSGNRPRHGKGESAGPDRKFVQKSGRKGAAAGDVFDVFYEILQALLLGLMAQADSVWLHWFDAATGELQGRTIRERADIDEVFLALYQSGWMSGGQVDREALAQEKTAKLGENLIEFDGALALSFGGKLVKQFTVENYVKELAEEKVVMP